MVLLPHGTIDATWMGLPSNLNILQAHPTVGSQHAKGPLMPMLPNINIQIFSKVIPQFLEDRKPLTVGDVHSHTSLRTSVKPSVPIDG